jgi:radical SAM superfamily enzyme YgiQ (UPF0313 family)
VQGRVSRTRSPNDIEVLVRRRSKMVLSSLFGTPNHFFVADDNFARNKHWEPIFDRLIKLKEEEGLAVKLAIQVDVLSYKIPNFVNKAAQAGVESIFIGLESINPESLIAAKKRQNKITEYRKMLLAWKEAGIIIQAGYILGFPSDTRESIREEIEIIKKELPIDILEFSCLTPLPGSEDHKVLWNRGVRMDPDMNKYDLEHVVTGHPRMTTEQWADCYHNAWLQYYTPEHIETVLRRAAPYNIDLWHLANLLFIYSRSVELEHVHPIQVGILRRKHRLDRRPGLPVESLWKHYLKYTTEIGSKHLRAVKHWLKIEALRRRVRRDAYRVVGGGLAPFVDDKIGTQRKATSQESSSYFPAQN